MSITEQIRPRNVHNTNRTIWHHASPFEAFVPSPKKSSSPPRKFSENPLYDVPEPLNRAPILAAPRLKRLCSDPNIDPIVTNKTPGPGKDILEASANNLYVGVKMKDLDNFMERHPLNSRLVKRDGKLVEEVYRIEGRLCSAKT